MKSFAMRNDPKLYVGLRYLFTFFLKYSLLQNNGVTTSANFMMSTKQKPRSHTAYYTFVWNDTTTDISKYTVIINQTINSLIHPFMLIYAPHFIKREDYQSVMQCKGFLIKRPWFILGLGSTIDWKGLRELTKPLSHGKLAPNRVLKLNLPHKKQGCQIFDYDVRYYHRSWLRNFPFNETRRREDVRLRRGCRSLRIPGSRNRWGAKQVKPCSSVALCAPNPRWAEGGSHSR